MNDVSAQVDKNLGVKLDRPAIVLVTPVQDSTRFQCFLLLADAQTLIDREVAPLHEIDELRSILPVAEDLYEVQE